MAWTKGSFTDVIGTHASKSSVSAAASAQGDFDCNATNPFITATFNVTVDFGSTPDGPLLVEWFGKNNAQSDYDTVPIDQATIEEVTSTEEIATYQIDVSAYDTVRLKVTNQDTTDSVTVWASALGAYA